MFGEGQESTVVRAPRRKHHLFRARERLGKYRIEKRLSDGFIATVYQAFDTIEGVRVALKVPHVHLMDKDFLEDFRREVRMAARMQHDNVLHLKNATFIGKYFVIAFPLGDETLGDRMQRRMSVKTALGFLEQAIVAVAHAHSHKIIHCDIKPDNLIIFDGTHLRLTDFGLAKLSLRSVEASGSGTIGYISPEQAMGKPTLRSDVFSLGVIAYQLLCGELPEWPFDWPPPGIDKLRRKAPPELISIIRKCLSVKPDRRYRDAQELWEAYRKVKKKALAFKPDKKKVKRRKTPTKDWRAVRYHQFQIQYGRELKTNFKCTKCNGPVSEPMRVCPWCGKQRKKHPATTSFPLACPRCHRGLKLDWKYCPWCYGAGFDVGSFRTYSDRRYSATCTNRKCTRKQLMPFMSYCPWCRFKVTRKWAIPGSREKCPSCRWGVVKEFWSQCPWCSKRLGKR